MAAEPAAPVPSLTHPRISRQELLILLTMEDDTENAPWMVMHDAQMTAASVLLVTLRAHVAERDLPWYVASMIPILYRVPPSRRRRKVAPDLFVAHPLGPNPLRRRASYDVETEGGFPPFVLEALSPESVERDLEEKLLLYDEQGAREYVLFNPESAVEQPQLQGFHRHAGGRLEPWGVNPAERLESKVLGLNLFVQELAEGPVLRAETPDGQRLLTLEEERAKSDRLAAEVAHLRSELDRERRRHRE